MKEKPIIVGIAGGAGAGKTILARAIVAFMNSRDVVIIQHDCYYKDRSRLPPSEREKLNYDHPDALDTNLLVRDVKQLMAGNEVEIPLYNFASHCRTDEHILVAPAKTIVLEGILLLVNAELRELMDVKVFVDADNDVRFIRRLQRDIKERSRNVDSVIKQYIETVRPMHIKFVEPSKKYADIIVPDALNQTAIEAIVRMVRDRTGTRREPIDNITPTEHARQDSNLRPTD